MKRICLLSFLVILTSLAYAKVLTVSNRAGTPAQYATITAAMTAAAAGDTIYIHGSETEYGNFDVDKKLVFIGPGHNPQKQVALKATLGTITLGKTAGATGSSFIGLIIYHINSASSFTINDITIKRCYITYIYSYGNNTTEPTNWVIENNIIVSNLQITNNANNTTPNQFQINNNIFTGIVYYAHTCFFNNNVFIATVSSNTDAFYVVKNCTFQNNIFYGVSPEGASNSTFNNNLTYSTTANPIPYGTNFGTANKVNADPVFTNFPAAGDNTFKYEYDFHLQASSPGKNAGTDGKDIGLYGGIGFSESGEPAVPQIREFVIKNSVIAPNSKLNISIKAEAKN
ncbi:hypothetical protein GXP67_25675 [Rhodocytophaga rosea]|uniref:Right handed beta helix domain-containing protein n=1 Tax=Rhodocytophaga rosea TaxID=2704465 RepID=A0A6C0GQE9_9BACT|nr:hypothetical protein [Rhodocytophaga rosea]QHT69792.1 hypothetical protein GXP67_25675 [Rhodocytophaga rosea]